MPKSFWTKSPEIHHVDVATTRTPIRAVAPMLSVSFESCEEIDLSEVHALIATSRNGLRALKAQGAHRIAKQLPIYVVGMLTSYRHLPAAIA